MKKTLRIMMLVVLSFCLFASCSFFPEVKEESNLPKEKSLHVSIVSGSPKSTKALTKTDFEVNGNITKKNVVPGKYQGSLTPTEFVLQLQSIFPDFRRFTQNLVL